jgi:hypothetical protein
VIDVSVSCIAASEHSTLVVMPCTCVYIYHLYFIRKEKREKRKEKGERERRKEKGERRKEKREKRKEKRENIHTSGPRVKASITGSYWLEGSLT